VLRALDQEKLQANAQACGEVFRSAFAALQERHSLIGDVRGCGMLQGVELVTDRRSRAPVRGEALRLQELLREAGVIVGLCGADHHVLKINPPLCVAAADIATLAQACDESLARL
jgi:4-aminobutyrate aminotransferase-like enzyme